MKSPRLQSELICISAAIVFVNVKRLNICPGFNYGNLGSGLWLEENLRCRVREFDQQTTHVCASNLANLTVTLGEGQKI